MEVCFADIGRGTSNLILLGGSRAIVIDCGQNSGVLLQLLAQFHVDQIARLILSHNHDDHVGGALSVLTQFEGRIEQICCLHDGLLLNTRFGQKVLNQIKDGVLRADQLVRLESDPKPRMLFRAADGSSSLKILSPQFVDNLQATDEGKPNATSGVLILTASGMRVVFAGDSTIRQWRRIREARGSPVDCDILSVAHHGGIVWGDPSELEWLYAEGVRPKYAIVSVSTSNTHKHPRPEVIKALVRSGATVACTQITKGCCSNLEGLRPGVLLPILPGRSRKTTLLTRSGNSKNVACGGTILAAFEGGGLRIHRLDDHQSAVDRLAKSPSGHPLCR